MSFLVRPQILISPQIKAMSPKSEICGVTHIPYSHCSTQTRLSTPAWQRPYAMYSFQKPSDHILSRFCLFPLYLQTNALLTSPCLFLGENSHGKNPPFLPSLTPLLTALLHSSCSLMWTGHLPVRVCTLCLPPLFAVQDKQAGLAMNDEV